MITSGSSVSFFKDTEENRERGRHPLSTQIERIEWSGASDDWNLRVKFFGTPDPYEYRVGAIKCPFRDALEGETYDEFFARVGGSTSALWLELVKGAKWTKKAMEEGVMPDRHSTGSAFHFLIKAPIGWDRKLYRKVTDENPS